MLEQKGKNLKHYSINYASCQTNPAEQKYTPIELEVAALVFAVGHFKVYLLGNRVTVYIDHQALVSAFQGSCHNWDLRTQQLMHCQGPL